LDEVISDNPMHEDYHEWDTEKVCKLHVNIENRLVYSEMRQDKLAEAQAKMSVDLLELKRETDNKFTKINNELVSINAKVDSYQFILNENTKTINQIQEYVSNMLSDANRNRIILYAMLIGIALGRGSDIIQLLQIF